MKNAAIIGLFFFSFLAASIAFILYRNYTKKCDISGGIARLTVQTCSCTGLKIKLPQDSKMRDGFDQNICLGIQTSTLQKTEIWNPATRN
jgi:hypothetical protein